MSESCKSFAKSEGHAPSPGLVDASAACGLSHLSGRRSSRLIPKRVAMSSAVLVVPCFCRNAWDVNCVQRLVRSADQPSIDQVIIVDDASPMSLPSFPSIVRAIRLPSNSGPACARNTGVAKALELGSEYLLFADHDCILSSQWAENMVSFLSKQVFSVAGGMTYAWGTTLLDKFHDLNGTLNGRWILPEKHELLYSPTCNLGACAEVVRNFRFDERYPSAAGEDIDFCLRVRRRYRIGLCREAVVFHDYGYLSTISGITRFVNGFMKYKSANTLLWNEQLGIDWTKSEAIASGD